MSIENAGNAAPVQENAAPEAVESEIVEQGNEGGEVVEEQLADAEAIVSDPNASKAEKAVAKKMLKSLKIKVDGKEYDEELPFEMEDNPKAVEYMQKQLQLAKVSQKRMQEKSEIENEVRDFIQQLRDNPEEILSNPHIGLDLKKFATKIIEQEIENEKKSPEQLETEKLKRELKALKDAQEKEKESNKQRQMEKMQQEAYERYDMQMDQAFAKNPDIPKSAYFVKRISDYMLMGLQNGMDVSPEDIIPIVREERKAELKEMLAASPDDTIEELLGKERLTSYQKKRLAKAKAAQVAPKIPDTGTKAPKEEEKKQTKTIRDMFGV